MKIGIIVHSHTGNTYYVIQKLRETLSASGHSVNVERIAPVGGEQTSVTDISKIRLQTAPDVGEYDAMVFAGPVRGASVSPVLGAYLNQMSKLKGKKVICLVTEFFPYPWMGGNQAIAQMKNICESKGAAVCGTGVVNWISLGREKKITEMVKKLSGMF